MIRLTLDVLDEEGPAFRSLVLEMSEQIGARLQGGRDRAIIQALTRGASGLGKLRAAVCTAIPTGDRYWPTSYRQPRTVDATLERERSEG